MKANLKRVLVAAVVVMLPGTVLLGGRGPATEAAGSPPSMTTYVPSDLHTTTLSGSSASLAAKSLPISETVAKHNAEAYFDKYYPRTVQTMPVSVSAVHLVHTDSPISFLGSQYVWLVTVAGLPNHWSKSPTSPCSQTLIMVSATTGKVLEQVTFTERTNKIGSSF